MSVIIRLQNLPWSANALDIRQYFHGLSIPEGGVHIVGGELGDAFIAFSTDEDARQAMLIDGGKIKEVKIKLYLSSRSEMQKVIETARAQSLSMQTFMQMPAAQIPATPMPAATQIPPTPPQTAPAMPPMPPISQIPTKTTTPEIKPPPLPPLPTTPAPNTTLEVPKTDAEPEKKDQDSESVSSREAKRSKRRSRSKSKNRSKSRDRSKSRERSKSRDRSKSRERSRSRDRSYRSKDRYRDRRRRDRSRSRDRRDRRRYRDRSRSRDRSFRKLSRDRKRDSDRNDRNSTEKINVKPAAVPEKDKEIPLPTQPIPVSTAKPGFSTSGWVSVGTVDKPASSILTNPIGFSIGKQPSNPPVTQNQATTPRQNITQSPQQIPLPQSMQSPLQMPSPQSVTTITQPPQIPHTLQMPQPPPFPQLPIDLPKDHDGRLRSMNESIPSNSVHQPNIPTTQQNALFAKNMPQMPQSESHKIIPQNIPGPMINPTGWPILRPPMDISHAMNSSLETSSIGMNPLNKPINPPQMNFGMEMYMQPNIRPTMMPPNEKFPPQYVQQDPRLQSGFSSLQPRNDYRPERPFPQVNNFPPQNQNKYTGHEYDVNKSRDLFSNSCVEIRNMAMNTSSADIRRFFHGLQIPEDGVKIITDKKGNKVGMAYVRFSKVFLKELALKKSGQMLKNSVVEVLHIDDNIFDKATDYSEHAGNYYEKSQVYDSYNENFNDHKLPTEPFTDIVLHEIPSYATDRDIYNLFKGLKIADAFVLSGTGRKTATGYVRFRTPVDARKALTNSSRLSIGYANIKAAVCYEREFADARDRKNMEENDEEMMEPKDTGYDPHETRELHDSKKYPPYEFNQERSDPRFNQDRSDPRYNQERSDPRHNQERSDPRYNQNERRGTVSKGLLPTPSFKSFDPRSSSHTSNSNSNNFPSRFERRNQDLPPRAPREDFHKKPYTREEFHQKPISRESSRFQPKPYPREENKKPSPQGEYYKKNQSHDEYYENYDEKDYRSSYKYPSNTPTQETVAEQPTSIQEASVSEPCTTKDTVTTKDEIKVEEGQKPSPDIEKVAESPMENSVKSEPHQKNATNKSCEVENADTQPIKIKEEIISKSEENESTISDHQQENCDENEADQINKELRTDDLIETDCIILRGLPFSANDRDILDFFSDEGLAPTQIHIMLDKQEQPAGDAFCEFNTVEEVARALTKDKTLMGRSMVSVEPVSREEMIEALGVVVHQEHLHTDCPPEYPHPRQAYRFPHMPSHSGYPPRFPQRGRGRGSYQGRHHPPTEREMETQNVNAFGKPGCVVALENVPYRAEIQDILDFFRGFYVPRDNIIRRFDENGKPTGDARVCFSSPLEAHRAIRTLNFRPIYHRQVHLSLVPF